MTDPTFQITTLPDEPWYEGADSLADLDQWGFPIAIDNRPFLLDTESQQFSRRSVQLLNTQNQDGKGDVSSIPPEVWRRNAESWHLGAGQDRLDRQDSLPHRYEDSRHIDPWQEFGFSLLHETELLHALPAGEAFAQIVQNTYLFVGTGTTGWWWDDIDTGVPSAVTFASPIVAVTSDGADLFALLANGKIMQVPPMASGGTEFATIALPSADRGSLFYMKGWLVAGGGNVLYQVTQGSATILYTHHQASWTWRAGADGLSVGYVLGGSGDKWTISRLGLKQDATGLEPPIVAATLPDGEIGYALASYLGYVMVGLNTGWRFCMPASDGSLTYGQLVTTDAPVECFEGQDRFVWYGMSEGISLQKAVGDSSGLGRADLSNFTSPMTPAYARDLDAGDNGPMGRVGACVTYGVTAQDKGRRVFTIDGVGVYKEARTLCPQGWLVQGGMTFGTADRKRGLYVMVTHEPLMGEVYIDASEDSGPWVQIGFDDFQGSIPMGNMPQRRPFHITNIRYRLHRQEIVPSTGPRVTRMEYRGIPIVGTTTEWVVPLLLSEQIAWDNVSLARNVYEDYEFLVGLVKERRRFIYREGQKRWILYAIDFDWRPTKVTNAVDTFQGTFHLICRELD